MIVLVCECGKRIRAPGATPGRVGRCPDCGRKLVVPEPDPRPAPPPVVGSLPKQAGRDRPRIGRDPTDPSAAGAGGYGLEPANVHVAHDLAEREGRSANPRPPKTFEAKPLTPMADGPLPPLRAPEKSLVVSFLHPLRGAECLGVMAGISAVLWIFTVLTAEYSMTAMADASQLGARLIGMLFAILAAIPGVVLGPMALLYLSQYLARVLVSSAQGDCRLPRAPDRNPTGVLDGLFPWVVWLFLGIGVALIPAILYPPRPTMNALEYTAALYAVGTFGILYASVALMLAFFHDDPIAANPLGVLKAFFELGLELLRILGAAVGLVLVMAVPVGLAVYLRPRAYWTYLLITLVCWFAGIWCAVVYMRVLGLIYYRHARYLRWRREDPRWGATWRA